MFFLKTGDKFDFSFSVTAIPPKMACALQNAVTGETRLHHNMGAVMPPNLTRLLLLPNKAIITFFIFWLDVMKFNSCGLLRSASFS
jgi:hypothetical protein